MRPGRYLKVHDLFNSLAIGHPMDETAYPTGTLCNVYVLGKFSFCDKGLKTPVDVSDRRYDINDCFVFKHEIQVYWFW